MAVDKDHATLVPNTDQRDTDGDGNGYGNIDADINQDLVVDFFALSILDGLFGQPPGVPYADGLAVADPGLAEALSMVEMDAFMAQLSTSDAPNGSAPLAL